MGVGVWFLTLCKISQHHRRFNYECIFKGYNKWLKAETNQDNKTNIVKGWRLNLSFFVICAQPFTKWFCDLLKLTCDGLLSGGDLDY